MALRASTMIMAIGLTLAVLWMAHEGGSSPQSAPPPAPAAGHGRTLVVAGGCFWCTEAVFNELRGVLSVESGYAGGSTQNPTYEDVCTGQTGYAESIKITYDPDQISAHDLLRIFFTVHDPTQLNRQGNDTGTQYRSAIFYATPEEKALGEKVIAEVVAAKIWPGKIVTTLEPLRNYTRAEEYHQDYFGKFEKGYSNVRQRMNYGYCTAIIEPKVLKFRKEYADRLKKKP